MKDAVDPFDAPGKRGAVSKVAVDNLDVRRSGESIGLRRRSDQTFDARARLKKTTRK